jgi:hypothetical protein
MAPVVSDCSYPSRGGPLPPPNNGPPPVPIADNVRGFPSHRPSGWLFFKLRDSYYIARPPCGSARLDLSPYL